MSKYLIQASYTSEGLKGLQKDKASGRRTAVMTTLEELGGKLDAAYFCLGEYDAILVVDLPNTQAATAFSVAVSASGLVHTKTTALLTIEETDHALGMRINYKPPGR